MLVRNPGSTSLNLTIFFRKDFVIACRLGKKFGVVQFEDDYCRVSAWPENTRLRARRIPQKKSKLCHYYATSKNLLMKVLMRPGLYL